jgi:uncharacterized protein (TIGR03437 family)
MLGALTGTVFGQVFSTSALTGKYFARHVQFTTDINNNATDARSITGAITFDGNGNYSFTGQQVIGIGSTFNVAFSGTYSVSGSGTVSLTNPQSSTLTVNARFASEAVIGSSTEAPGNTFDLFVAIPAPSSALYSNSTLSVSYNVVDFELTAASTAQVRDSIGGLQFDGQGNIQVQKLLGHGASLSGGVTQQETSYSGAYSLNSDGSGTLTFQLPSGQSAASQLLGTATRNLAVSASGNVFLAGTPGAHDILIGVHAAASDNITAANFNGRYWASGIETDTSGKSSSYVASTTVITSDNAAIVSEREHQSSAPTQIDVTSASDYSIGPVKSGAVLVSVGSTILGLGNDSTLLSADVGEDLATGQSSGQNQFAIGVGVRIPTLSGSGVFVNPQGVVNAAGNAPVGNPISPGEFIAIYGSGLSTQTLTATPPYTAALGGVSVSIGGFPAPMYLVSPAQINCLVPYEVNAGAGSVAITVTSGSARSNTITQSIAPTAPGVFSIDLTGTGDGAITHANNSLVNSGNPAVAGETLVVYLTGLGVLQSPIVDGQAPVPEGTDSAVAVVQVQVDGVASPNVSYAGINPVYPGLYQINFQVPPIPDQGEVPLLIVAGTAGTQEVTLFVQ